MEDNIQLLIDNPWFLLDVELREVLGEAPEVNGHANRFRVARHGQEFHVFGVGIVYAEQVVGDLGVLSFYGRYLGQSLYVFDSYKRDGRVVADAMVWYASLPEAKQHQVRRRRDDSRGFTGQVCDAYAKRSLTQHGT